MTTSSSTGKQIVGTIILFSFLLACANSMISGKSLIECFIMYPLRLKVVPGRMRLSSKFLMTAGALGLTAAQASHALGANERVRLGVLGVATRGGGGKGGPARFVAPGVSSPQQKTCTQHRVR